MSIHLPTHEPNSNERSQHVRDSGWIGGGVLIMLGTIFLLHNFDLLHFIDNWWALFLFVPVVTLLGSAWNSYLVSGRRVTRQVTNRLSAGIVLLVVGCIFLFGVDFGQAWPVLLIAAGSVALINSLIRGE